MTHERNDLANLLGAHANKLGAWSPDNERAGICADHYWVEMLTPTAPALPATAVSSIGGAELWRPLIQHDHRLEPHCGYCELEPCAECNAADVAAHYFFEHYIER
jgi:hypothetical protein